jgi:hypothetical protein
MSEGLKDRKPAEIHKYLVRKTILTKSSCTTSSQMSLLDFSTTVGKVKQLKEYNLCHQKVKNKNFSD